MTSAAASPLFEPIQIGRRKLANRLVHVATLGNYGRDGLPTEQQIAYYARRAAGGVGLIVTEGMSVHPSSSPNPAVVRLYAPEAQEGLNRLTAAVHAYGVPILAQLWHVGRQQLWGPSGSAWGVSSLPDALSGVVPHVMTVAEIREIVQAFVDGARAAQAAGFDGVEVHGAHGYLVTQFLSPWSNTRDDEYGGSFDNRLRFLREILSGIRAACGRDFIVGLKLSGSEFVEGGLVPADTQGIVQALRADDLVDLVAINQGNFSLSLERHVPDMHWPQAPFAEIIRSIRLAAGGLPVVAIGRIIDREVAERLLQEGTADLIGMARALISDPDLPRKWRGEVAEPVRRCISCNVCWHIIHGGRGMLCIHNPEVGAEADWLRKAAGEGHRATESAVKPVAEPSGATVGAAGSPNAGVRRLGRIVHVIGGGPAGMEVAWVAASRGLRVTLWERSDELGGQVRFLAAMPGLAEYGDLIRYQCQQLERYGVEVRLGQTVTLDLLTTWEDAVIVVATGSTAQAPPSCLAPLAPLVPDSEALLAVPPSQAGRAVVFDEDGSYYAYGPALLLARRGWRVTLVTSRTDVGWGLDYLSRIGLNRRLRQHGVLVLTGFEAAEVTGEHVLLRDVFTGGERVCDRPDLAVWAGARAARDDLWRLAADDPRLLRPIGDAYSPRKILAAVHEGHRVGLSLSAGA